MLGPREIIGADFFGVVGGGLGNGQSDIGKSLGKFRREVGKEAQNIFGYQYLPIARG